MANQFIARHKRLQKMERDAALNWMASDLQGYPGIEVLVSRVNYDGVPFLSVQINEYLMIQVSDSWLEIIKPVIPDDIKEDQLAEALRIARVLKARCIALAEHQAIAMVAS